MSAMGAGPPVRSFQGPRQALEVSAVAALGLVQGALPLPRAARAGTVIAVSPDAAAGAYGTWGGCGASKAAPERLAAVLGWRSRSPSGRAVGPGEVATDLCAAAVPGDDGPRPEPVRVVPAFPRPLRERPSSGRYEASALPAGLR
ncbi:hypothetical protein ACIF8T_05535 [Streptomyces sp. NPDC085946]|uniref:hypothetical protein n=1 Tax=Streptomyces sp. NPDC085946 TaxID=3365744 RepID=UPI0037D51FF6